MCSESGIKRDYFVVIREGQMWSKIPNYLTLLHSVVSSAGKGLLPCYDVMYGFVVPRLRKWFIALRAVVNYCAVNDTCWKNKSVWYP